MGTSGYLPQVALASAGPGMGATWELWVRGSELQLPKMRQSSIPSSSPSLWNGCAMNWLREGMAQILA